MTYCREGKVPGHVWMALLTNRVFEPRRDADMQLVRRAIWEKIIGE